MPAQSEFHHKIGLGVRVLDSTSGKIITESNVSFLSTDKLARPISKTPGVFFFLNLEPTDFDLTVHIYGYEPATERIRFAELDDRIPMKDIFLIPKESPNGQQLLSIQGKKPGIKTIQAVAMDSTSYFVKEYDQRKRIITVFSLHNNPFSLEHYGLLNKEKTGFEALEIIKEISKNQFKIKATPEKVVQTNQQICRIIPGLVKEDGSYLLRVLDENPYRYLVKYEVEDEVIFETIDFREPISSSEGGDHGSIVS